MEKRSTALPEGASLEYLKKLAKDRLEDLRRADPGAKLADAMLSVARDHGFSSWRALKAEIEQRHTANVTSFFDACANGDVDAMRRLLATDPRLARASNPLAHHENWTALHTAASTLMRTAMERAIGRIAKTSPMRTKSGLPGGWGRPST